MKVYWCLVLTENLFSFKLVSKQSQKLHYVSNFAENDELFWTILWFLEILLFLHFALCCEIVAHGGRKKMLTKNVFYFFQVISSFSFMPNNTHICGYESYETKHLKNEFSCYLFLYIYNFISFYVQKEQKLMTFLPAFPSSSSLSLFGMLPKSFWLGGLIFSRKNFSFWKVKI